MYRDTNICRFFGAPACRVSPDHLVKQSARFRPIEERNGRRARAYGRIAWDFLLSNPGSMGFYRKSEVTRHYDLLETLGSGSFSIVKRATRLRPSSEVVPDVHVAVKMIDKAKVDNMIDIRVRFLDPVPVHAWLRGR